MAGIGLRAQRWAVAAMAVLALAGCNAKPKEQVVRIYNWSDYIDPALLTEFTRETGIKVTYDTFDSNEVLETKILTGATGYDLVVPSNHNIPRYVQAKAIQPIDHRKLAGAKNLWPDLVSRLEPFDPGSKYTVPYMWGTIGIGYNVDAIKKRLPGVTPDTWALALDPANLAKLKDCGVYFLDASEDMFGVTLNYLGKDPNSKDPADYALAADHLAKLRPYIRKFNSSEYLDALANGDICLAIGYSGDVLQAKLQGQEAAKKVRVEYVIPKEGSQVWFDLFVMPKDAPNPEAAYKFLDFMLRPDVIARASNYVQYANANLPATPMVDPAIRGDPNIYPTPAVFSRLFVTEAKDQALLREVNRNWTRVTTGR